MIWAETRCSRHSSRSVLVCASQALGTALRSPFGQAHLLGMPAARARALSAVAAAALADPNLFSPSQALEDATATLRSIRGIGEWTAQYIAMRVLREPDAFPAADIGLMRALTPPGGARPATSEVL